MHPFLRYATERQAEIVRLIQDMVECESPSDSPDGVNRFVELVEEQTKDIARAKRIEGEGCGDHLRLEFELGGGHKEQVLALGHSDTVWPLGTLNTMPFREAHGRLWGPGVLDMKSGLAFFIYAVRCVRELKIQVKRRPVLLMVSDEEVGSRSSRVYTEAEARRSHCVLVLEPGTGVTGKLKTARKGVAQYTVRVQGRAAHAGVDFENGASAIVEAARQVETIAGFTDLSRGVTVNPGLISGGTRTNVIAAEARIDVDVRIAKAADAEKVDRQFRALRSFDERCDVRVSGGLNRPPMERTAAIGELFLQAKTIAEAMGIRLEESATGGGSDGNFTAALGVPTLDGLGGVGEGAHATNESIAMDRIADRTALLAGLLAEL